MSAAAVVVILSPLPRRSNGDDPPSGTGITNLTVKVDGLYADPTVGEVIEALEMAIEQLQERESNVLFADLPDAA